MSRPQWIEDAANQHSKDAAHPAMPRAAVPLTLAAALGPAGLLLLTVGVTYGVISQAASAFGLLGGALLLVALIELPIGVYRLAAGVDRIASEHGSTR